MISNDDPSHREQILQALKEAGLGAREYRDPQGREQVIVPVLDTGVTPAIIAAQDPELRTYFRKTARDWPHRAFLYITTMGQAGSMEVGVVGHNGETDEDYLPEEWGQVETVEEVVEAFQGLWRTRDALLNAFMGDLV